MEEASCHTPVRVQKPHPDRSDQDAAAELGCDWGVIGSVLELFLCALPTWRQYAATWTRCVKYKFYPVAFW